MNAAATTQVGLVLFPKLTQLDLTAPYEVFARMPDTRVHLVAESMSPVPSEHGLALTPTTTFDQAPDLDLLCVPGGIGVNSMMEHEPMLEFLSSQGQHAQWVTSVCTGALLLGAAGLLRGYRVTTHWLSLDLLPLFGAEPVRERVVIDRNRITGGGVTAGLDFGLAVAAEMHGREAAEEIQLMIEYSPAPPFQSGSRDTAPVQLVERVTESRRGVQEARRAIAMRAAERLVRRKRDATQSG
jgi:cyclohexyl-isocyanide hydratase